MSRPWSGLLQCFEQASSTMDLARSALPQKPPHGQSFLALQQSTGRGRHGRSWFSAPNGALMLTTILRPPTSPEQASQLSLVVALSVTKTLKQFGLKKAQIKWPNDILLDDQKLAGILLEMEMESRSNRPILLVGLGLNIKSSSELSLPNDITDKYIGLADLISQPPTILDLAREYLNTFESDYGTWLTHGIPAFSERWLEDDALLGRNVRGELGDGVTCGQAQGIASDGALILKLSGGERVKIKSGEVTKVRAAE